MPSDLGTPVVTAVQQAPTRATNPPPLSSPTQPASPMSTRELTAEAVLSASPSPRSTQPANWTAAPDQSQAWTASPADITAIATSLAQRGNATATPSPTPTRSQPTVSVRYDLLREAISPPATPLLSLRTSAAAAFEYEVQPGPPFAIADQPLTGGLRLFSPNPTDSSSYLYTDQKGILRFLAPGAAQAVELTASPFHPGYSVNIASSERNKHRVVELDWSADGRQFSFRIDTPAGLDNSGAGVWFWHPEAHPVHGHTFQIIRDCAHAGYRPCGFVNPSSARHWQTLEVQWSPMPGDARILLTLQLPDEGRRALAIARAVADPTYANDAPPMIRYDSGHWDLDAQRITVSGRRPDGRVVVAQVNAALADERVLLDGAAQGLWLQDAARLPNGEVVALGRHDEPGSGPLALYNQQGRRISAFAGDSAPDTVRWFADRSGVVLSVSGRQYLLRPASGALVDASQLASQPQFSEDGAEPAAIPEAVIRGAAYFPGQQLRVFVGALHLRETPATDAAILDTLLWGEYVAVFAGPYDLAGDRWWRVQTAQNRFGWIAGSIAGAPTVGAA
ncbi:MAG: SH3 domain-containing protein [Chloroflexi bacterium]|nr:SH3 domain-containing protein [Chloroflexota bacterium]